MNCKYSMTCSVCGKPRGFAKGGRISHAKCSKVFQERSNSKPDKKSKPATIQNLQNFAIIMRAYE